MHPGHITPNIVYSTGFRLLRICSREDIFEARLEDLKNNFLLPRNCHHKNVDAEFKKVRNHPGNKFTERRMMSLEKKLPKDKQTKKNNSTL